MAKLTKAHIDAVQISLKVGRKEKQALFILLASDGSINRLGSGAVNNRDQVLYIGKTEKPLFGKLMTRINNEFLSYMGGYEAEEIKGAVCELMIQFRFVNGHANGFVYRYGANAGGPPQPICDFVNKAAELTDPWHEEQKKLAGQKPWWQFW